MDDQLNATWLRHLEGFGGKRPAYFADPTTHHDLTAEQREASWAMIRIVELKGSALGDQIYGRELERALCDACASLPATLTQAVSHALSERETDVATVTHMQNAWALLPTMHTCRVCALLAYVVRRSVRTGALDDFAELTAEALLPGPLEIMIVLSPRLQSLPVGNGDRRIKAIRSGISWTRLKARLTSVIEVLKAEIR